MEHSGVARVGSLLEAAMGDTQDKQHVRRLLEKRLDSYYEVLMEAARRETGKKWELLLQRRDEPHAQH
jgi:hypothetical protein